ncbi:hypothetical protein, partial [Lactobacillus taiwanensis]|uniref:hypothetical protein n=1 Tax=Lactobacillus taiwanensis TaxID=508451 RepID=UPI0025B01AE5
MYSSEEHLMVTKGKMLNQSYLEAKKRLDSNYEYFDPVGFLKKYDRYNKPFLTVVLQIKEGFNEVLLLSYYERKERRVRREISVRNLTHFLRCNQVYLKSGTRLTWENCYWLIRLNYLDSKEMKKFEEDKELVKSMQEYRREKPMTSQAIHQKQCRIRNRKRKIMKNCNCKRKGRIIKENHRYP